MKWPGTVADADAVIVREDSPDGTRFVVHSRREPQFTCSTYREAESRTLAYAKRARAHAWYTDGNGFQLLGDVGRPASVSFRRERDTRSRQRPVTAGAKSPHRPDTR